MRIIVGGVLLEELQKGCIVEASELPRQSRPKRRVEMHRRDVRRFPQGSRPCAECQQTMDRKLEESLGALSDDNQRSRMRRAPQTLLKLVDMVCNPLMNDSSVVLVEAVSHNAGQPGPSESQW